MHPKFTQASEQAGLAVVDPIETRQFTLQTDSAVEPTPTEADGFAFPVESACQIQTSGFELQHTVPVDVRAGDGTHLAEISPPTRREFEAGAHLLDLHGPVKLYVAVDGRVSVAADTDTVRFDFGDETEVRVGARSYHSSPAETITVPDDPAAMMEAISTFPSALKTTSPERSWPTLRGHPPRIECGDSLDIPDGLATPNTGISIEVPAEYGAMYTVAPLAFYLGAELVPSESARLTAESGVDMALGGDSEELADSVTDLLKRVFTLDCVTRTEGYHQVDLHERDVLESRADFDFDVARLYDTPIDERLAEYLAVPDEAVEAVTPQWHRMTHVRPDAEVGEMLAAIVDDLSLVRVKHRSEADWSEAKLRMRDAVRSFFRRASPADTVVRSPSDDDGGDDEIPEYSSDTPDIDGIPEVDDHVGTEETNAFEQAWAGGGTMLHATELIPSALARETPEPTDGVIDITVVCNDPDMKPEAEAVSDIYGQREGLAVAVETMTDVPCAKVREVLREDTDLFHFVGHIDGRGFECPDGILDTKTVTETGATAVLLNGCRSYDQGRALVEAGANATITTLWDIPNRSAVEIGQMFARLLNHGFSVGIAATIVREYIGVARDYLVLGDPSVTITQPGNGTPVLYHVTDPEDSDEVVVEEYTYPNQTRRFGTVFKSYLTPADSDYHIAVGSCRESRLDKEMFRQKFADEPEPLVIDGGFVWSDDWFDFD